MKYILYFLMSIVFLSGCTAAPHTGSTGENISSDQDKIIQGAKLPPTGNVTRKYPRLVNYFHMSFDESKVSLREERLAQWDVIILNPDNVLSEGISLSKIRATHPDIKILAWLCFGQEPDPASQVAQGIPPESDPGNWFIKDTNGQYIHPPWGGHLMDPYKNSFAWPKFVITKVTNLYLKNGLYDGIMFDCLTEYPITFNASNPPDLNGDQVYNDIDVELFRQGMLYLLENLRTICGTNAIFTGNGGIPWATNCPYFTNANGNMDENALGNEFGTDWWYGLYGGNPSGCYGVWDGYQSAMNAYNPLSLPRYHFISADVRENRSQTEAQNLTALTPDDLRRMRMGLTTSMLMDGGYSGFDRGDCLHGQLWWFDEYDADLVNPKGPCQTNVFGPETYSREFENGIVIVNNNSTSIQITLASSHIDITDKKTNTVFTLPAYDGRIYLTQ